MMAKSARKPNISLRTFILCSGNERVHEENSGWRENIMVLRWCEGAKRYYFVAIRGSFGAVPTTGLGIVDREMIVRGARCANPFDAFPRSAMCAGNKTGLDISLDAEPHCRRFDDFLVLHC